MSVQYKNILNFSFLRLFACESARKKRIAATKPNTVPEKELRGS